MRGAEEDKVIPIYEPATTNKELLQEKLNEKKNAPYIKDGKKGPIQVFPTYERNYTNDNSRRDVYTQKLLEANASYLQKKEQPLQPFIPVIGAFNPNGHLIPNTITPVANHYTINVSNPLTSHPLEVLNDLYEDYLLPSLVNQKYSTVESRITIYNILRNTIINKVDGQEIAYASPYYRSILSYVKVLETNPYHLTKDGRQPYHTNPYDMVVLSSGYPIRYMQNGCAVDLGRENVNINLRIYRLNNGEYFYPKLPFLRELHLNPWRELLYYQYVQKNIVHAKRSPHFVTHYGYCLMRSKINFDGFNEKRGDKARLDRYRRKILGMYRQRLEETRVAIGGNLTRVRAGGFTYFGGGVLLLTQSYDVLLVYTTEGAGYMTDIGGAFRVNTSLNHAVIEAANRNSNNSIVITHQMLEPNRFIGIPISDPSGDFYRICVIKVEVMPIIPNSIVVNITRLPTIAHPRIHEAARVLLGIRQMADNLPRSRLTHPTVFRAPPVTYPSMASEQLLAADAKVSLLVLTESPTNNMMQWTSRKYNSTHTVVKTMERLGMYPERTWHNVLFQIMQGLCAMQKNRVLIKDMTLANNVFVKDIPALSNNYWVYNIEGTDYYVPNDGYLVMFDLGGLERDDFESKVLVESWGDQVEWERAFENFVRVLDPDNFTNTHVNPFLNLPPTSIRDLLVEIRTKVDQMRRDNHPMRSDITFYIHHFMMRFLHPRIGTLVNEVESARLSRTDHVFQEGELVAYRNPTEGILDDIWAVYRTISGRPSVVYIDEKTKMRQIDEVDIYNNLTKYASRLPIDIKGDRNTDYTSNNMLERYVL